MAHSGFLTKNLGWRLLLLLFWTVLVCCILYASKGSSVSVIPKGHVPVFSDSSSSSSSSSSRLKRVAGNVSPLEECKAPNPSREDLGLLERAVHTQGGHAADNLTVHCSVVNACGDARPFRAHCFSRDCRAYRIRVKNGNRNVVSLSSSEELSHFVESSLPGNTFTTIEDLGWHMDIGCQDPQSSHVKITGDVLSAPQCHVNSERGKVEGRKSSRGTAVDKINVLYFRFLSHWEIPIRFPGLVSLIQTSATQKNTSVIHFDKYQATHWGDDETLSLLLQGNVGPFIYNHSLLDALHINGYCFHVADFSCSRSRHQQVLINNVSSYNKLFCGAPSAAPMVEDFCAEDNSTDSEIRALLTSLMSDVHDVEAKNGDARPLLSISILNTKDFRHSEVLDQVLMNLFANVLTQDRRTVLLMSDVGNPVFLRFDVNVRLQTQASNPALLLLSTAGLSEKSTSDAQGLVQRSPFSIVQLHHFLKQLIQNKTDVDSPDTGSWGSYDSEGVDSCGGLNVKPPFTCLCEGQFVSYENDTLMAGFAQFAVSLINTQLQHVSTGYFLHERSHCARLSGVSFTNVRVGFNNGKRRILMDINLENELFKDRVTRRVVLDIWNADKIPQAAIEVFKPDPLSLIPYPNGRHGDDALKTLCQTGERLDHPTSSEAGLLKRWSQEKHLGRKGKVTHVHDSCLYLLVRDFGDSISVEAANVCGDRRYDVLLHLSVMNMMSLGPLPLSASLGRRERRVVGVVVKVSYTVPTFAYKLHPDFHVTYHD